MSRLMIFVSAKWNSSSIARVLAKLIALKTIKFRLIDVVQIYM